MLQDGRNFRGFHGQDTEPGSLFQKAKKERYPARSVYKLQEIDRKMNLFRAGQSVLDLGASPGSWSMYARERTGPSGPDRLHRPQAAQERA